jgi:uncharacterized protein YdhG (YjbR/CyaY superfamily)
MAARIKTKPAKNIDEYIGGFPGPVQERMQKLRANIKKAAPAAEEMISYAIAGFILDGALIYFAGFKNHIGIYPVPRSEKAFKEELAAYKGGKGTAQFPHDKPLPLGLVTRIVKYRMKANKEKAAAKPKKKVAVKNPALPSDTKMYDEKLKVYDKLVATTPHIERKGKTMPYTSANGYMFSQLNKDGEIGIRLSKESGEKFMKEHKTTIFKSYGAVMKDYVLVPGKLLKNLKLLSKYMDESYRYVMSLDPK